MFTFTAGKKQQPFLCVAKTVGSRSHRRTGQHPFGGADRVLPEWIQWGGGRVVAEIFRVPYSVGGGVVAEIFRVRDPYFLWGGRIFSVNSSNRP